MACFLPQPVIIIRTKHDRNLILAFWNFYRVEIKFLKILLFRSRHLFILGFFNRVIIQSGIGSSLVGFFDRKVSRAVGIEFAQRLGCKDKSSRKILQCLLEKDASVFPPAQEQMYVSCVLISCNRCSWCTGL